jgi:glutathione synthase/RimK-type ligase-like ATP-grasp enzyme
MKLAIHKSNNLFTQRWIDYCIYKSIPFKIVNCYSSNIIKELEDCDALMWHFNQNNPKDILCAKEILYSLQTAGKKVFPDFNTAWHFDDKLGQKYLLESLDIPLVQTWVFYDKNEALKWVRKTDFPKVIKLRRGSGSQNVKLVKSKNIAVRIIKKAFRRGFPVYDPLVSLKERLRKYNVGITSFTNVIVGIIRFFIPPPYSRLRGRERGYIYFQKYIGGQDHDIRVIVINNKAFAIKRMVRSGDFRASGSGDISYDRKLFDQDLIKLSFSIANKLKTQCVAFDFIMTETSPLVLEISYGFVPEGYESCPGYWDSKLNWHEGKFDPYGWMVENLVASTLRKDQDEE